jgi:hypothetical protein
MDEAPHTIEAHIDRTRERLGSNLRELEDKFEAATDWREQFRARPHLFVGGAFIGAALVAAALRPKSPRPVLDPDEVHLASASRSGVNAGEQAAGFDQHLRRAEQRPDTRRA